MNDLQHPPPTGQARPVQPPTPAQVRSSRPGYAVLRRVGGIIVAVLIGSAAISAVPGMATQEATGVVTLDQEALAALERTGTVLVEGDRGDIVVREAAEGQAPGVTTTSRWSFREPDEATLGTTGEELVVSSSCPSGLLGSWGTCSIDVELVVPPGTSVEVRGSLGTVDVETSGEVSARTSLGDIRISGTPEVVHAETSLGGIRVRADEPPALVSVISSLGDVDIQLPGAVPYAVEVETSLGDQDVRVQRDPEARHTVRAETSLGGVRIVPGD